MAKLPYDKTVQCVQCGYCLPACPTYMATGKETQSPRGRINLVKLAAEQRIGIEDIKEPLDLCLGCRACEPACPSGVEYGAILKGAKEVLNEGRRRPAPVKWAQDLFFQKFVPSSKRLNTAAGFIRMYQTSGLQKLARKAKLTNTLLPEPLSAFETVMPALPSSKERRRPRRFSPPEGVDIKWKVAFFTGCIMDAMFEKINRLSLELLAAAGCEVLLFEEQTCCGALHAHSGRIEDARRQAKLNIAAFEAADVDFIVNNAGGCGAMLVEYGQLLSGEPEWENRAAAFSRKSRDISQVLAEIRLPLTIPINETVTYQRSCHMTNVQKVVSEPLKLLQSIPGIRLTEMENPHLCCGSAGTYNIVHHKEAMSILDIKMNTVKKSKAAVIVTTNPGCLLQMQLGIARAGLSEKMRAVHLVELLAESAGLSVHVHSS
ncbi:MAG: (Fe-S)-binding protein [Paenibacillus sp.]|uniref:(Fe-S)-binding protein n=1 Tax=Paenibacillus sp. TaxID=58172 RepID=UPI0029038AB7|nr:(Fe-S)-binding protein [Paenibacillus sp.]MDU2240858.1 (Fe-S)-binding protein [Paenibacillus sp.]